MWSMLFSLATILIILAILIDRPKRNTDMSVAEPFMEKTEEAPCPRCYPAPFDSDEEGAHTIPASSRLCNPVNRAMGVAFGVNSGSIVASPALTTAKGTRIVH